MPEEDRLEQALINDLAKIIEQGTGIDIRKQNITRPVVLELRHWLDKKSGEPDWSHVAHHFVNQETSFFRSHLVWRALDDLLDRDVKHVWFAGCSSGEEAYSLLLLASQKNTNPVPGITATDLSQRSIESAMDGHYLIHRKSEQSAIETFSGTRLFEMSVDGSNLQAVVQMSEKAREQIDFSSQNLLQSGFRDAFDLIICRNVLVHMSDASQAIVLDRLSQALMPGGFLILGDSDPRPSDLSPIEIGGLLLWSQNRREHG